MLAEKKTKKKRSMSLKARSGLPLLLILLPFGLYFAMEAKNNLTATAAAGAFVVCMGVMVWLG